MEREESVLEALFDETETALDWEADETLDADGVLEGEDVEMADAEIQDADAHGSSRADAAGPNTGGGFVSAGSPAAGADDSSKNLNRYANKKRKKRKNRNKGRKGGTGSSITDINRFVIETCKHLKEKKPYLIWNAIGCLGVSVIRDLIREVDIIQKCGGQKTADGSRSRLGGGILWNILKAREPKAYNEIMEKGREFEKQFRQPQFRKTASRIKEGLKSAPVEGEVPVTSDKPLVNAQELEPCDAKYQRKPVKERIRVPVSYSDLLEEEEGEIRE